MLLKGLKLLFCFLSLSGGHYRNPSLSLCVSVTCEANIQVDVVINTNL